MSCSVDYSTAPGGPLATATARAAEVSRLHGPSLWPITFWGRWSIDLTLTAGSGQNEAASAVFMEGEAEYGNEHASVCTPASGYLG